MLALALALVLAPAARAADPSPATAAGGAGQGLTLRTDDDRYALKLQTRMVPRVDLVSLPPEAVAAPEEATLTRATIATARLWLGGHVFDPKIQYMTQLAYAARDYRDGTISPVFDAYVDAPLGRRGLRVRAGQYFVRFDRLRTVREFALQLTDRPIAVGELTLDRDVGVTLYDDALFGDESPLALHVGLFGGRGINQVDARAPAGGLAVARVELRPLGPIDDDSEGDLQNRARPGLALGLGGAWNHNTWRTRSTTGGAFTDAPVHYAHAVADAIFKWRGLSLAGEALLRTQHGAPNPEGRPGHGAIVQAGYHFRPGIEPTARWSRVRAAPDAGVAFRDEAAAAGNELSGGLNWYINGHRFKLQTSGIGRFTPDWERASLTFATQLDASF